MTQNSVLIQVREGSNTPDTMNCGVTTKIQSTVTSDYAFIFYEAIGNPTGYLATNLFEFCWTISQVTSKCLIFHLMRGDFENWIRGIIGDVELVNRICKLKNNKLE